jgi:hypothetical protein
MRSFLTWMANVSEVALWNLSSWLPTFFAVNHKSLVSSAVRSTKRFTSRLGQTSTCTKSQANKIEHSQGVLCIINWIKLYIITKFDQHSKGILPFMKWPAHEILSAMLRCLTMSLYKCWMHMQIVSAFSLLDILVLMACTSVSSHMYNSQTLAYTLCSRGCVHQIQFLYAQKDQH